MKVTFIITYIGKWPVWFRLFVKSCENNPDFDFLFLSSEPVETNYENIQQIDFSIQQFNQLASAKLQIPVNIKSGYKVCDFRPAFGLIFEDYLADSDFWGYMDVDIILGDLSTFFPDSVLNQWDVLTTRKEHLTGHLTLVRNNDILNTAFRLSKDYRKVFSENNGFAFDECGFIYNPLNKGIPLDKITPTVDSFTHVVTRNPNIKAMFQNICEAHTLLKHVKDWKLQMINGKLINLNLNKEVSHMHFHAYKRKTSFYIPKANSVITDTYYITERGFQNSNQVKGSGKISLGLRRSFYFLRFYSKSPRVLKNKLKAHLKDMLVKFGVLSFLKRSRST